MEKISVIVPIYNCEEYLYDCLESIVRQTYPLKQIEVLMINDGTKDKSDLICNKYAKKYNWKFIDRKENRGLAYTRNEGIKKSLGKYILFLDSDDVLYDDALYELYKNAKKYDSDVVVSKINSFNSKGQYGYYSDKYLKNEKSFSIDGNYSIINCISACGKLYKGSFLKKYHFLENTYHEDNYFTLKVFLGSKKISVLPKYTYYRRIREGDNKSIMQNLSEKTYLDLLKNFKSAYEEVDCDKKNLNWFMARKTLNYIAMNIEKKQIRNCKNEFNKFVSEMNYRNKFDKIIFMAKCELYYYFARLYKILVVR